jgi:7-cyano-7-deazaguanine synthase
MDSLTADPPVVREQQQQKRGVPHMSKKWAFVLLSGGVDSTTCLAVARVENSYERIVAFSIDYGQRHSKEIEAARLVAGHYLASHETIKLGEQPRSMLTDPKQDVPNVSYDELPFGVSPTYVPFRNGQLLSAVTAWASAAVSASNEDGIDIYFGAHAGDQARDAYPDCTPEFVGAMAAAIYIGTYHKVRLKTPLIHLTKAQVVKLGTSLGAPYDLTWSCYKGGTYHCGICPTCRARKEAFQISNILDPTVYDDELAKRAPILGPLLGERHD